MSSDDNDNITIHRPWWDPSRFSNISLKSAVKAAAAGLVLFVASRYRIARSNERIIRTGLGLKGIHISQQCIHIPYFQTFRHVNLEPCTYKVPIEAMSKERISFHMPTVWTLAPKRDAASLARYAERLIDMNHAQSEKFFAGIIEGEGRILAGSLELDQLQGQREDVRQQLTTKLAPDFDQVGIEILNVNVAELVDTTGQEYFAERRKRALSEAMNTARTAVAEATLLGDTGVAKSAAETRERKSQYERQATLEENKQLQLVWTSKAELAQTQANAEQTIAIAKSMQIAQSQQKESEFQKQVEEAKQQQEVAKQRALQLSMTLVEAEKKITEAKGIASAAMERATGEAKAIEIQATAAKYAEQQRAQGIYAVLNAEASGLQEMVQAVKGDVNALTSYMLVQRGGLETIMRESSKALTGMKPTISISQWNHDKKGGGQGGKEGEGTLSTPLIELLSSTPQIAKEMERITGWKFLPQLFNSNAIEAVGTTTKTNTPNARAQANADTTV